MRTLPPQTIFKNQSVIRAKCLATDSIGDAVSSTGEKVGGLYQVTKTDIDNIAPSLSFSIGVISSKITTTTCIVVINGILTNIYIDLDIGSHAFVGVDGALTTTRPAKPLSGSRIIQIIGYAITSTDVIISPMTPVRILA